MRTCLRISLALLIALALSTPVHAQSGDDRISLNASIGPPFATLGTTVSTTAGLDYAVSERVAVVGELGLLPYAPFRGAAEIAPPVTGVEPRRVHAYHPNGNVKVRPFETAALSPYFTAGLGVFTADAAGGARSPDGVAVEDRRRVADFATNVGAGVLYRLNDWAGLNADHRPFFVHRSADGPRVHRVTTGLSLFLK